MNVNGNNPVQGRPPTRSQAGRDYQETIDLTGGTDDDQSVESFSPHHLAAGDDTHRQTEPLILSLNLILTTKTLRTETLECLLVLLE